MQTKNIAQRLAFVEQITPAATRAAGTYATGVIDASRFERLIASLQVGTLAGAATINLRWQHGLDSGGSDMADIDSTNCITSSFASASNDKIARLELRLDQRPAVKRYVRALVSTATSTWIGGVQVHGLPSIYQPASDYNASAVAQTVVY
jgi:hypothetical protein